MGIGGEIMKILVCEENGDYVDQLIEKLKSFPCDEELVFESYTQTPGVAKRLEREEYDMAFLGGIINEAEKTKSNLYRVVNCNNY